MGSDTVKDLDSIQKMLEKGNYGEARPLLKAYLAEFPNDALAIRLYGNTFAYTGYLGKAKRIWRNGLRKFPENVDLIYNFALAHYLQGNLYYARRYWRKALKYAPDDSEIYFNLGQIARDEGQVKKAISYWRRALKHKPDNIEIMNNIGVGYASLYMHGKAAIWYKKAVKADSNYALAHFNLANALFEMGRYESAKKHAVTSAKLDPASHMETVALLTKKIDEKISDRKHANILDQDQ